MADTLKDRLAPYLDALVTRKTTNKDVADALGYSPESVSRALAQLGIAKAPREKSERQRQHELFEARKKFRDEAAASLKPQQAARAAGCSLRTIYRRRKALKGAP
jgi:hypothetical protein